MVKVKICGITNLDDARLSVECGADALGFVFAKSPRRILPEDAASIIEKLPPLVIAVGLFVNEQEQKVNKIIKLCRLNAVQFHGAEPPDYCSIFKKKIKVIKTFKVKNNKFLDEMVNYNADAFLLDTYAAGQKGGTGRVFDWTLAAQTVKTYPNLILAGGLNPDNVSEAVRTVRPYAVDVSSGVELSPGKKDLALVKKFIAAAKNCSRGENILV